MADLRAGTRVSHLGQSPANANNIFRVAEVHPLKRPSALCPEFNNHRGRTAFSSFAANG